MKKATFPFHIMIKPCGPICNLACDYCYYLPKAQLYPGSDFRMSYELLEDFTRQMFAAQPGQEVNFSWQGGEPTLMGLDFYQEALRLQHLLAPQNIVVSNSLQTNGTLIDAKWCQFFRENNFLVGLSLDGPAALHNEFRHTKDGRGSFDGAMQAVDLFKRFDVNFNILCSLHQANCGYPLEVYRFLRKEVGAEFIQFIPILQRTLDQHGQETQKLTSRSVNGPAYGKFLTAVFDEWVRHDVGKVFVQIFDLALGKYLGHPSSLCVFSETCGRAMVLEHNGDVYACDHFVNPDHLLGNITQMPLVDLVDSEAQKQFGNNKCDKLPQTSVACEFTSLSDVV